MDFLISVFPHLAGLCWLALGARMKITQQHLEHSEECLDHMICRRGACDVENSNKAAGRSCECLPGFTGKITWSKGVPEGTCLPASCKNIVGAVGQGPECKCTPGLSGEITWDVDTPEGECHVDAIKLFKSGSLRLKTATGEKDIKCCVSSHGHPTRLQDLNAKDLPTFGKLKRGFSANRFGCGYMFGDGYHSGSKSLDGSILNASDGEKRREPTCPVEIAKLMEIADLNYVDVLTLLDIDVPALWYEGTILPRRDSVRTVAQPDVGVYVRLVHDLDYDSKAKMISSQIEASLGTSMSWFSYGLAPFIGNSTFMTGLKKEMLPVLDAQLKKSGVQYTLSIKEENSKAFGFLLMIVGIDPNAFVKANIGAVRDGLIASLTEGVGNLAATLDKNKVPDASITTLPVNDNGVNLLVRVSKSKLLAKQVGMKAFAMLVDAFSLEQTTCASIANKMALQLESQITSQLADNGIIAKVYASATDANGRQENGEEFIEVGVTVTIVRLRKAKFEKVQLVSVRDTVVRQLSGNLQQELLKQGFPARVETYRCGWKGPFPAKDKIDSCASEWISLADLL